MQSSGGTAGTIPIALQNTSDPVFSVGNDPKSLVYKGDLYFSGSCGSISSGYEPCRLTTTPTPLAASFTGEVQQKSKIENTGGITALYNAGNKQIIINNESQMNFTWQLVSINGSFLSQGKSANTITNVPTGNIATGTYILICSSAVKTDKIRLVIF